jgi:hypothetical protein
MITLTTAIWFLVLSNCAALRMAEQKTPYDADVLQCRPTFPAPIDHYSDRAQFDRTARDPIGLGHPIVLRKLLSNGHFRDQVTTTNFAYLDYDLKSYAQNNFRRTASGSDRVWFRRARIGGWMSDGTDNVPLVEESDAYEGYLLPSRSALTAFQSIDRSRYSRAVLALTAPKLAYAVAEMAIDGFVAVANTLYPVIDQLSGLIGRGFAGLKPLRRDASPFTGGGGSSLGPVTAFHYANNGNFSGSTFLPGPVGFNLADVSSPNQLEGLPLGVKGLMWSGNPNGADGAFITLVTGCVAHIDKLFAIYLADTANPDPGAIWGTYFDPANLQAQVDYIHLHLPGIKTYIWLANLGSDEYHVDYTKYLGHTGYTPSNTGIDYYGIAGYPVARDLTGGYDLSVISNHVAGALAAGIPLGALVPTYQTFGGGSWGRPYVVPDATQLTALLARWASLVPNPPFDYAYSWGTQRGDTSLESLPLLQAVMLTHNLPQGRQHRQQPHGDPRRAGQRRP